MMLKMNISLSMRGLIKPYPYSKKALAPIFSGKKPKYATKLRQHNKTRGPQQINSTHNHKRYEIQGPTLSLRAAFFCSKSSITRARRASRALSSCSLKGQSLGIPGSFSTLGFLLKPSFLASLAFFLWCSFTFLITLCFCFKETLLLLLSAKN